MEYERTSSEPEAGDTPGGVIALDAASGSRRWEASVGGTQMPVTIADGTVVAAPDKSGLEHADLQDGGTHPLVALDAARGSLEWKFEALNTFYSSPAVTDDRVYVGFQEQLWAIQLAHGEPVWTESVGRHVDRQSPVVVGEAVVIGDRVFQTERCHVNALDAHSGEQRWSQEVPEQTITSCCCVDATVFLKAETFGDTDSATVRGIW